MAPKSVQTAPEMPADDPRHAARATRTAGRQMRSRLLDGASRLFRERGLAGTSISDIAAAADAFPSQITYYFRTKEALFVESACREMLSLARAPEESSRRFWAGAVGVMIEGHAMGRSAEDLCSEMLRVLGDQATTPTGPESARLRLVDDNDKSDGEGSS